MNKSEQKTLAYLKQMFPGYASCKTAGEGLPDFMLAPPPDTDLPMLFVESKCGPDRARLTQKEWADSEFGQRCRKYVVYSLDEESSSPCFLYTWHDWRLFVEGKHVVPRDERKDVERRASIGLAPGTYVIQKTRGADAAMRLDSDGTCTLLAGSSFRLNDGPSMPKPIAEAIKELQRTGKMIVQANDTLKLTEDTTAFTSTGKAATAVLGRSASRLNWQKREPASEGD